MLWMVCLVVVGVWTQNAHMEESESRDGRLLFKDRQWTDDYRPALATIERSSKPFVVDDDNLLDALNPRPFLTGRGSSGFEERRSSSSNGETSIPKFRFPSDDSDEENPPQYLERFNHRQGRVLNTPSVGNVNVSELPVSSRESQQQKPAEGQVGSSETSRKASPDVQDIIDGIVKLLGGKVHNGTPGHPGFAQRPQMSSPNPVYNLFNPTKPIVFPTPKPTRVNNRGPPLANGATVGQGLTSSGYPATPPYSEPNRPSSTNQQSSSFEAIPLEALNSDFNLNKGNFGPPFLLNKKVPSGGLDAPYKKGVPVPEQLVPTLPQQGYGDNLGDNRYPGHQNNPYGGSNVPQYNYNPNYNNNNYGTTVVGGIPSTANTGKPTSPGTKKPLTSSTLLNPVIRPNSRPTVTTGGEMEDDEEDELRFTTSHPTSSPPPAEAMRPVEVNNKGVDRGTTFEFSQLPATTSRRDEIRPTPTVIVPGDSVYPTLVLETNSDNGLVEIVTKYETLISPSGALQTPTVGPTRFVGQEFNFGEGDGHKHVTSLATSTSSSSPSTSGSGGSTTSNPGTSMAPHSIHSLPTPPLRKGIVISDTVPGGAAGGGHGVGSVEVVTALDGQHGLVVPGEGGAGEVFDVTVTAKQSYGGQNTGIPFGVPGVGIGAVVNDVITAPKGTEQFVSIDGKRTYFNLHPNTAIAGVPGGISPSSVPTQSVKGTILPVLDGPGIPGSVLPETIPPQKITTPKPRPQNIGVGSVGNPVPLLPQAPGKTLFNSNTPVRPISTTLNIQPGGGGAPAGDGKGNKSPPNLVRRTFARRPSVPPVRIDTCIVGDDSTCNAEQFEVCRTENGVSSCVCKSGYARRKHREPCKAIVSLIMSIKLDKLGDKKLNYNPDYFNPNSEIYQTLEWETIHALDSSMSETTLSGGYVGAKLDSIGFDGKHAVVNTTILIQENAKIPPSKLKLDLQKQMIQVLTRNRNNFGKSQLWVEGPISAVSAISDFDECEDPDMNDCHSKAHCVNTLGSFECRCEPGYGDPFEKDKRRSGRRCESCSGKNHCNGRGECLIENGQRVCMCSGNYYGSQCDIDGEVLAVAIGASVSAVVIIGLTLACLCMWSRKWKKEEQKAALMSRMPFGGMATQALSYLGGKITNPYQQHISMDERLRWAQVADGNMTGNIYVQNDPMSMHTSPTLMGQPMMESPPMMSARRSAETVDTTMDDMFEERQPKRPRSRASCSQLQGGIYYDLEHEPQNEIYASRSMMHIPPAQFCVPMTPMGHYAHSSRGFYT